MSASRDLRALFIPKGKRPRPQNRERQPLHVRSHTATTLKGGERVLYVTLSDGTKIQAVGSHGSYEQWITKNGWDAHGNKKAISLTIVEKYTAWLNGK